MKELIKNKPWKKWKTRKISFIAVLLFLIIYTVITLIFIYFNRSIDSTVTTEVFKTGRWVITTGTSIVLADSISKIIKHNDDEIE
jgi:hypothetical protein|nr:MAG TPA: hypothetical protein [Caudoviricetes sp.]